jgi:molybdate transport system substrate-binding protein
MLKRHVLLFALLMMSLGMSRAQGHSLTIFAAASLTNVFEDIAARFKADHPDSEIFFNFASSSELAAQLAEGAPADIFASANNAQMTVAIEAGRIAGTPQIFAKNRLVLIVPIDNPANIAALSDLANEGIKLVIAAPDVPVRTYTDTMLERLAADSAYGETYRAGVLANVVSEEQNVRQVAAKVALGEADAGIVYISDITSDIRDHVTAITIPDAVNTIASYPIALTNDTPNPELAQEFIDFVLSDAGQDVLIAQNFVSVRTADLSPTIQKIEHFRAFVCGLLPTLKCEIVEN